MEIRLKVLWPEHPDLTSCSNNLGTVYHSRRCSRHSRVKGKQTQLSTSCPEKHGAHPSMKGEA